MKTIKKIMNKHLRQFLDASDLDELQQYRENIDKLDDEDKKIIYETLSAGQKPQSVANILFYPELIPVDIRVSVLVESLVGKHNPYYQLAAIVGLQNIPVETFSEIEKQQIHDLLFQVMESNETVLAARASATIRPYVKEQDRERLFRLLEHINSTVRHNILGIIYEMSDPISKDELIAQCRFYQVAQDTISEISKKIQQHEDRKAKGKLSSLTTSIYTYIPNMSDV
jgi:hypothetical protein